MNFIVVGTNHKYSPIELRERIAFSKKRIQDAFNFLNQSQVLESTVILSTCNRVEIYAGTGYLEQAESHILDFISRYHEIERHRLDPYFYIYKGKEAIRHLFQVAAGLDSQVLGEVQILGQVESSIEDAFRSGFADAILIKIFISAISFAKEIHKSTRISEGKLSIGNVAIDFIKEKVGALANKKILIIGVGKVSELMLKYLKKEEPRLIFISNRTYEKAKELAIQVGSEVVRFDSLKQYLRKSDIVISATSSPHFIIKKDTLEGISNKIFIIDLAVPRDVDPQVKEFKNVNLYSLEDLDDVIKKNIENRVKEAEKAKGMIDVEVERLWKYITRLEPEPALLP
jgi:glutamyl-tRNA reductase